MIRSCSTCMNPTSRFHCTRTTTTRASAATNNTTRHTTTSHHHLHITTTTSPTTGTAASNTPATCCVCPTASYGSRYKFDAFSTTNGRFKGENIFFPRTFCILQPKHIYIYIEKNIGLVIIYRIVLQSTFHGYYKEKLSCKINSSYVIPRCRN